LKSLARQLTVAGPQRELVAVPQLLRDAVALVHKEFEVAGCELTIAAPPGEPRVRGDELQLTQAVVAGLAALREVGGRRVHGVVQAERRAVAGGRERACVVLRLRGEPLDAAQAAQLCDVVGLRDGATAALARTPARWEPLAVATLVQQRCGGALDAAVVGSEVRLDYVWPAVAG
jgi:hypothetical protein